MRPTAEEGGDCQNKVRGRRCYVDRKPQKEDEYWHMDNPSPDAEQAGNNAHQETYGNARAFLRAIPEDLAVRIYKEALSFSFPLFSLLWFRAEENKNSHANQEKPKDQCQYQRGEVLGKPCSQQSPGQSSQGELPPYPEVYSPLTPIGKAPRKGIEKDSHQGSAYRLLRGKVEDKEKERSSFDSLPTSSTLFRASR